MQECSPCTGGPIVLSFLLFIFLKGSLCTTFPSFDLYPFVKAEGTVWFQMKINEEEDTQDADWKRYINFISLSFLMSFSWRMDASIWRLQFPWLGFLYVTFVLGIWWWGRLVLLVFEPLVYVVGWVVHGLESCRFFTYA